MKAPEYKSLTKGFCSCSALLGVGEGCGEGGREEGEVMCSITKPKTSKLKVIIIRKPTENLQG